MKLLITLLMLLWPIIAFGEIPATSDTSAQSVVEGTLIEVSKLPSAEVSPYPDCYFTAVLAVDHVVSGQRVPGKVALVLPGFFSRKYATEAKLKYGDKIHATLIRLASMPDSVRQTQQADDIEDISLEFFYARNVQTVEKFTEGTTPGILQQVSSNDKSVIFQPVDENARAIRSEWINSDLKEINKMLAKHGGDWEEWFKSYRNYREEYKKQFSKKASRWIGDSFFSAGYSPDGKIYSSEFISSVISLKRYLEKRNVDLILVRVPNKGEIVEDLFSPLPLDKTSNPYLFRMYKELLEADVEIIADIIPKAKAARLKYPLMFWYQDFAEGHPAEGMSWVIAEELAKRVKRYMPVEAMPKKHFLIKEASQPTRDFKWPGGNPRFSPNDYVRFAVITDDKGKRLEIKQSDDSPILMLGSSFIAYPSLDKGGSIPHYLTYLTGIVPDILFRAGGDKAMLRSVAREGDTFLAKRSVCLFPFVPDTALSALSPLPLFDPYKSHKQLISSYSGPDLQKNAIPSDKATANVLSFSSDGLLQINPIDGRGAEGKIHVIVPTSIKEYPSFAISIEFASNDTTYVAATYADQMESTLKSNNQIPNEETFAFHTKQARTMGLDFNGNSKFIRPIIIKSIKFYGIKDPKGNS